MNTSNYIILTALLLCCINTCYGVTFILPAKSTECFQFHSPQSTVSYITWAVQHGSTTAVAMQVLSPSGLDVLSQENSEGRESFKSTEDGFYKVKIGFPLHNLGSFVLETQFLVFLHKLSSLMLLWTLEKTQTLNWWINVTTIIRD